MEDQRGQAVELTMRWTGLKWRQRSRIQLVITTYVQTKEQVAQVVVLDSRMDRTGLATCALLCFALL